MNDLAIGAIFGGAVGVIGALGAWWLKYMTTKSTITVAEQEARAKINVAQEEAAVKIQAAKDEAAAKIKRDSSEVARQERKDTIAELYELLKVQRDEREEDRTVIHDLRNEMTTFRDRLTLCEYDREGLRMQIEDQKAAIEKAGIVVNYRPLPKLFSMSGPIVPHGPNETPGGGSD